MTTHKRIDLNYDYIIINTGYIGRLLNVYNEFKLSYEDSKEIELLFLNGDEWHKDKLEIVSNTNETTNLINKCKELNIYKAGIALFRCNQNNFMYINHAVEQNHYCVSFGIQDMVYFKGEKSILYIEYATESG